MTKLNISRDPSNYTKGYDEYDGVDAQKAPFYLKVKSLDDERSLYSMQLIDEFNDWVSNLDDAEKDTLKTCKTKEFPEIVILIDGSSFFLPTSPETMRIFKEESKKLGKTIQFHKVNTKEELLESAKINPSRTLIYSQCTSRDIYNVATARQLKKEGVVIVPGVSTAPGGIFSDKARTNNLLKGNERDSRLVAMGYLILHENRTAREVAEEILNEADRISSEHKIDNFFIKPILGGGGLGGFRLMIYNNGYVIPDLSKVTGKKEEAQSSLMDTDIDNEHVIRELVWIYNIFFSKKPLKRNYIKTEIYDPVVTNDTNDQMELMKSYLQSGYGKRDMLYTKAKISRNVTIDTLTDAIEAFEKKFNRRYAPIIEEHIDFGTWGLRAHYRLSSRGVLLESMYGRIFQMEFGPYGIGYVGSDNISNSQTGELELDRLEVPNEIMVNAIGGKEKLFRTLYKGARTVYILNKRLPEGEISRVPIRLEVDLAPVSGLIGEVNADTARGLVLGTSWNKFENNTLEWFYDGLGYYSRKKEY